MGDDDPIADAEPAAAADTGDAAEDDAGAVEGVTRPADDTSREPVPPNPSSSSSAASAPTDPAGPAPDDSMGPPAEPCECWCMHCRRTFPSTGIWFQRVIGDPSGFKGFWKCPTPNCDGAGFTFDIFPTDPNHPANDGWSYTDYDEDDDDACVEGLGPEDGEPFTAGDVLGGRDDDDGEAWDPDEAKWKELGGPLGGDGYGEDWADDDDLEGEEWKLGLQPGERPPEPEWMEDARREREEEERQYDEPDRRPREVDWSDREDRADRRTGGGDWREDDIPF